MRAYITIYILQYVEDYNTKKKEQCVNNQLYEGILSNTSKPI